MEEPSAYLADEENSCLTCHGEGAGEECELELDWINYGRDWVTCPDCGGTGRESKGRG